MIGKMTRYDFILLSGMKDGFLENLRELGVVDIERSSKPVDPESEAMLSDIASIKAEIKSIKTVSDARLDSLKSKRDALAKEVEVSSPWGEFDRKKLESAGARVRYYCIQEKKFDPAWAEQYPIWEVERAGGSVWFVVLGDDEFPLKENAAPARPAAEAEAELKAVSAEMEKYAAALESRKSELPKLEAKADAIASDLSLYLAGKTAESAAEDSLSVFRGFAPVEEDERLCAAFDAMELLYVKEAASVEDNPPINFRNNKFVRMFEVLTDMYGRPAYNGFDPTPFIAVFFLLFFAMCIGDIGYGLVLAGVGLLLKKVKSFANLAPLVVTLGLGTVVVGFFFHTFFSVDISQWACIPDGLKSIMVPSTIAGYDGTMIVALVVGIVHLLLAMIVKTVYATKNKGFKYSLSTWGWTVFWLGLTLIGIAALVGVLDKDVTKLAIIVLGCICAIGIFPLNNPERNVLKNIGSGLWDSYNMATGILGDILSYLRLYALGLAGAMLGFAFNDLAKMALGDGGFGWVAFVLIVLVGHTLNIAMAALGAFVHPLRLNFLEFFKNSDYEGVGVKYNPLKK